MTCSMYTQSGIIDMIVGVHTVGKIYNLFMNSAGGSIDADFKFINITVPMTVTVNLYGAMYDIPGLATSYPVVIAKPWETYNLIAGVAYNLAAQTGIAKLRSHRNIPYDRLWVEIVCLNTGAVVGAPGSVYNSLRLDVNTSSISGLQLGRTAWGP